jgi:hypothetical protein
MKVLALLASGLLAAVAGARADGPEPFPNRSYADIVTHIDESPTGRVTFGVGQDFRVELKPSMTPNRAEVKLIEPTMEQQLDDIEKKLDRILEELKGIKARL